MLDVLLHTGLEHPNLLWIVVPALLTFAAGLAVGVFSGNDTTDSRTETLETDE